MYIAIKKDDYTIIRNDRNQAEIELTNIEELNAILQQFITNNKSKILIDFRNVTYIDSSALGLLLEAMKKLKIQNRELGILSISRDILEVFIATQIAQFFKYYKIVSNKNIS